MQNFDALFQFHIKSILNSEAITSLMQTNVGSYFYNVDNSDTKVNFDVKDNFVFRSASVTQQVCLDFYCIGMAVQSHHVFHNVINICI